MNIERRVEAARYLLDRWTEDTEEADFPYAEWTVTDDGGLHAEVDTAEDAEIWAHHLGIDLAPAGTGVAGTRDYTPDGPTGVSVPVTVSTNPA